MPARSSKDHDFTRTALRVVEQAIGEQMDGALLETPTKNPARSANLVALRAARAAALSPRKRSAIAKKAALARWGNR